MVRLYVVGLEFNDVATDHNACLTSFG